MTCENDSHLPFLHLLVEPSSATSKKLLDGEPDVGGDLRSTVGEISRPKEKRLSCRGHLNTGIANAIHIAIPLGTQAKSVVLQPSLALSTGTEPTSTPRRWFGTPPTRIHIADRHLSRNMETTSRRLVFSRNALAMGACHPGT